MKIAVFDIGTNSIHMKIVRIHDDASFEVLEHLKDMTRIGEGSFETGKLTKRSIKRALKVIEDFWSKAKEMGVKRCIAVATSAVRDAKNSDDFIRAVQDNTGVHVRIISGEEEARLIFIGVASGTEVPKGRTLVVDIGGGSVEFVLGTEKSIAYAESLRLGVARLTSRFISHFPPSEKEIKRLETHIEERLKGPAWQIKRKGFTTVLGTAGTFINLASIVYEAHEGRALMLRGYFHLKRKDVLSIQRKLIHMKFDKLKKVPGLEKKRANTIVAGSILLATLMRVLKIEKINVCDKGIREGIILDYIAKHHLKIKKERPAVRVHWFGQKPFFSGRIVRN